MNPNQQVPLDWKVVPVDDKKSISALEELLNDRWVIAQVHGELFILARVKESTINIV